MVEIREELRDNGGDGNETLPVALDISENGINVGFRGYGDCASADGHGRPVYIEYYEGHPRILIWADINSEDPTHIISLEGALESKRAKE